MMVNTGVGGSVRDDLIGDDDDDWCGDNDDGCGDDGE